MRSPASSFYPIDYFYLSRDFLLATVHMIIILAVLKIFSARTRRDHFYALSIAFLELLASAILSTGMSFFLVLAVLPLLPYRRADQRGDPPRPPPNHSAWPRPHASVSRRASQSCPLSSLPPGFSSSPEGFFFLLPRTASAAFATIPGTTTTSPASPTKFAWAKSANSNSFPHHYARETLRGCAVASRAEVARPHAQPLRRPLLVASFRSTELLTKRGVVQVANDAERIRNGPRSSIASTSAQWIRTRCLSLDFRNF